MTSTNSITNGTENSSKSQGVETPITEKMSPVTYIDSKTGSNTPNNSMNSSRNDSFKKITITEEESPKFNISQFRPYEETITIQKPWGKISEPNGEKIKVRSQSYLTSQRKEFSKPILCPLVAVECWQTKKKLDHIVSLPYNTFYQRNISPSDNSIFVIVVHLQVQSINASFVTYHILRGGLPASTDDKVFNDLFMQLIKPNNDNFRTQRLKIIPNIISGPFAVQHMVKNKPCLLGTKVNRQYFIGKNYLEIDYEVDSSYLSASIIKLCHRMSTKIIVDLCWVIQGNSKEELPERVMCALTIHNLDFNKIPSIDAFPLVTKSISKIEYSDERQQSFEQENIYKKEYSFSQSVSNNLKNYQIEDDDDQNNNRLNIEGLNLD